MLLKISVHISVNHTVYKIVEKAKDIVASAVSTAWSTGIFVFVDAPQRIFKMLWNKFWKFQLFLIILPIKSAYRLYLYGRRRLDGPKKAPTVYDFFGLKNKNPDLLKAKMQNLTTTCIELFGKVCVQPSASTISLDSDDKMAMEKLSCSLDRLVKSRKLNLLDETVIANFKLMAQMTENVTRQLEMPRGEFINETKDCYNLLLKNMLSLHEEHKLYKTLDASSKPGLVGRESFVLDQAIDLVTSIVNLSMTERNYIKKRLSMTNAKLEHLAQVMKKLNEKILGLDQHFETVIRLNQQVLDLQMELDHNRRNLAIAEADKEQLQQRLVELNDLIDEEERYLDQACPARSSLEMNTSTEVKVL